MKILPRQRARTQQQSILWVIGAVEGVLLARLVARLLAARPDNPAIAFLYGISWPLVAPLAGLDRGQPQFGAVAEISTLVLIMVIALGVAGWWVVQHRR